MEVINGRLPSLHTFYERYTRVAIARTLHASDIEVLKREQNLKIG